MKLLKNKGRVFPLINRKKKTIESLASLMMTGALLITASNPVLSLDVKISGWVFQTIVDRDSDSSIKVQPLGNSLNAIAFDATHELGNGLTGGVNLRLSSFNSDITDNLNTNLDQQSVSLSGKFGTFDLGQNLSASAFIESYAGAPSYWIDPMGWLNRTGATGQSAIPGLASSLTTGSTGRVERLRYDTPTYSGFTGRVQLGNDDSNEVAILYSNFGVIANAFVIDGGDVAENTFGFLLAYNAPFGLHASYSQSTQDRLTNGEDKVSGWKLGYSKGKHAISYSMHAYDDEAIDDYERDSLSYVFTASANYQLYVQSTREERGSLSDDAIAFGVGIFF